MAKVVLTPITNFTAPSSVTSTNANYDAIAAAIENTISRNGTLPNQMGADLDMNGNDVMNVGTIDATNFSFEGIDFEGLIDDAEAAAVASQASAAAALASQTAAAGSATSANNSAIAAAASAAGAAAVVQPTLAAAPNKASPTDTDRITILDNAAGLALAYITIPNLVSSMFTTARTIANGVFASATFRLRNGTAFNTFFSNTALTADRTITIPDRALTLGITYDTVVTNPNTATVLFSSIPAGVRRITAHFVDITVSASALPAIRLGSGGVVQTTGYTGPFTATSGGAAVINTGDVTGVILQSVAGTTTIPGGRITFERTATNLNVWDWGAVFSIGATLQGIASGRVNLAGDPDRLQFCTLAPGTALLNGSFNVSWEF